jgi:uncharacterized protein (TIGR03437 family)
MDAAYTSLKKNTLFLALATLIPAAAYGQTAQFALSNSTVSILGQSGGSTTVSSTTGTNVAFSATAAYTGGDAPWLCLNNTQLPAGTPISGFTTPTTLNFFVCTSSLTFAQIPQHTATVTVTDTDAAGATAVPITINYTVGSGPGGGTGTGGAFTITPAAPSASTCFGCATSLTFTASTTSATPINFTLSPPGVSWVTQFYQSSGTSGVISAASPATFYVAMSGAGQAETTLSTQLFIDYSSTSQAVTISFGNGTGTGTTSGSLQVTPSTTVNLAYSTITPLNFPSATVTISGSADTNYFFNCSSGNFWLEASSVGGAPETTGSGTLPGTLTITVDSNVEQLAAGQSNGTITITGAQSGSVVTISVGLTVNGASSSGLTLSPSPLAISAALNGSAVSQAVTIISTAGGAVTASISGQGLTISSPASASIGANGTTTVTVTGTPTGLSAQTYTGQLAVTVGGVTQYDQVNFTVGSGTTGTGGASITAAPNTMTFASETGFLFSQFQSVYLAGSGNYTAVATTSNGVNWLSVSSPSGTLPVPNGVTVEANAAGLAAGSYTGAVTFTNTSSGATSVISVTLLVTGTTAIYAFPGDLVFNYIAGTSSTSQSEEFAIQTTDGSTTVVSAAVSNPTNTPWLSAVASGASVLVSVNAGNLANGVYTGYITVTGTAANSPFTVPVVLGVTGSGVSTGGGILTISQSSLTLQAQANGTAVSQSLTVSAAVATTFSASSQVTSGGTTWLSVSPAGTNTTNTTLTITANPAGLTIGTYTGNVYLVANGATQTIPVSFVVGTTGSGGSVSVTANGGTSTSPTLTFTASAVGVAPPTQYLTVSSAQGFSNVTFTASATTNNGVSWIQLSTVAGTTYSTPLNVVVTVNTSALSTGTFTGNVTITPTGGTAVSVPVTLTIAGAATIAVSNTSLNFSYQAGAATPNTQSVSVTVSNASTGAFTATATSTPAGWLAVTPTSGTAPGSLIVSITPSGLSAGTYTGSIAVAGASGATGTATINVTLTVTVPLPTITAVVNAASFVNEPIAPGEIITVGGTSIGPATPASFTVANGLVPTTLGGVQVLVNGFAAPVLYVSGTQINAIVPYEIAGILNPTVLVKFLGQSSNGFTVNATATAAGIFTANGSGSGPGAILNFDLSVNSASNAAARGSEIVIYMTGEGQTSPAGVDGKVTTAPYPAPLLPIAVMIGGAPATVAFMGEAPGLVSGVLQLNVIVPTNLTTTGAVPVSVTFGTSSTSQGGVTVNIR